MWFNVDVLGLAYHQIIPVALIAVMIIFTVLICRTKLDIEDEKRRKRNCRCRKELS